MSDGGAEGRKRSRYGLAAVGILSAATGAASLYTTTVCGCMAIGQIMLSTGWAEMDDAALKRTAEERFLGGRSESDVARTMGAAQYGKYCRSDQSGRGLVCTLPHDKNMWRSTHVELAFGLDERRMIKSVAVVRKTRYAWE